MSLAIIGILLLVGGLQLLHHGIHLRLLPHVVLLHAGLVYGLSLLQEHLVLGLKVSNGIVNLLCRAVVVLAEQASPIGMPSGRCSAQPAIW